MFLENVKRLVILRGEYKEVTRTGNAPPISTGAYYRGFVTQIRCHGTARDTRYARRVAFLLPQQAQT